MKPSDNIDWDEAARKAYHEMELSEDRDYFRRILGVSDFDMLRHDRMWRKHPSMAFASLLRHMVMAECVKVRHAEDAPEVVTILGEFHLVIGLAGSLVPVDIVRRLHRLPSSPEP